MLFAGEIIIRYVFPYDGETLIVNHIAVPPLNPPLKKVQESINLYIKNIDISQFIYDEQLGWTNHPSYTSPDKSIIINSASIRSETEYDLEPEADRLRIGIFGDSFTFSGEVSNNQTLALYLESALEEHRIRAEVINFGVPAYGPDQAYLRWLKDGVQYQPDIVLLSYSTRMSNRAINIFRVIEGPDTSLPFSKPRFYLDDNKLQLINSPTVPLDNILSIYENFDTHFLRKYEAYYDDRYVKTWWRESHFISYLSEWAKITFFKQGNDEYEEIILTNEAIIHAFANDVEAGGGLFMLGHTPTRKNLKEPDAAYPYYDMLVQLSETYPFLDGWEVLPDIQWGRTHYSGTGNEVIANYFVEEILECIDSQACIVPRFVNSQTYLISDN